MGLGNSSRGEERRAFPGTLLALIEEIKRAGYGQARINASSNRCAGTVPGTHEIGFDSADGHHLSLRHTARSRDGFARGALMAAQWVIGKRGLHEFSEK